ncbi:MAG: SusD/RagB family nutrient-binding outer membrane lipoprotein [Flavobacteriaceae bacterium]
MKNSFKVLVFVIGLLSTVGCSKDDFADYYTDPSKIATTSVDKQFASVLFVNNAYVLPNYDNYFSVLRTTLRRYTQANGWVNGDNQYTPSDTPFSMRWNSFYQQLAQYREMEKIYNGLEGAEKDNARIFMLLGTVYMYDYLGRTVDIFGDIPFSEASKLSQNGGDYIASLSKYDTAESIYTTILNDLKSIADELNTINVSAGVLTVLRKQDFLNHGDLEKWQKYTNSLRLRMLTRVSAAPDFQTRAKSEITEILNNSNTYPIIASNDDNIQINVYDLSTELRPKKFREGLEDWNGNVSGKVMIDYMNTNLDPRLRVLFEPGPNAPANTYIGLDQMLSTSEQDSLVTGGTLALYNTSTLSRNEYFPGPVINSAEVELLKAEAYLNNSQDALAQASYEAAITNSINYYFDIAALTTVAGTAPTLVALDPAEITAYISMSDVSWTAATTNDEKLALIAFQKWIHFNLIQNYDCWAEFRRLDLPNLTFPVDNANTQTLPPVRFLYPNSEVSNNSENYETVKSEDNFNTKIFWDVN